MKTAREIYDAYRIMPNLQMHQLRVAAAGALVCDSLDAGVNREEVALACLFHDMGNIIKSDFDALPMFLKPQGREYWQSVKDDFISKYGTDEHAATVAIGKEVGLPGPVLEVIDNMRFSKTLWILESAPIEYKICKYADLRAGPHGLLSLDDRLKELRVRYGGRSYDTGDSAAPEDLARSDEACRAIEKLLFAQSRIKPEDINDAAAAPIIEKLREYPAA